MNVEHESGVMLNLEFLLSHTVHQRSEVKLCA